MIVLDRSEEAAAHYNGLAEAKQALCGGSTNMQTVLKGKIGVFSLDLSLKKSCIHSFTLEAFGGKISERMRQNKTFQNS